MIAIKSYTCYLSTRNPCLEISSHHTDNGLPSPSVHCIQSPITTSVVITSVSTPTD